MTTYLCESCGVKTHMKPHLDETERVPTTDQCPNCGERDDFKYL